MLTPREKMGPLPGQVMRTRWTGGDATLHHIGAVGWGCATGGGKPSYLAHEASPYLEKLGRVALRDGSGEDWNISVVELLTFVILATLRASAWRGQTVYYVTDNDNVRSWLTKRWPRNAPARHLIRIVQRLEALGDFQVTAFYIRTYHNEFADWLTRTELPKVHEEMEVKGWQRLEPPEEWGKLVEDAQNRVLRIPGEAGETAKAALKHFQLRRPAPVPRALSSWTCLELGGCSRISKLLGRSRAGR